MAKMGANASREPVPGSPAAILRELIRRDGRSPRAISISSGMSPDSARNILLSVARPRTRTLNALAAEFGVDVRVLTGELPIPDQQTARSELPSAVAASRTAPSRSAVPKVQVQDLGEIRRRLRVVVRDAVRSAVDAGLGADVALADSVQGAFIGAVAAGLDDLEAAAIIGGIGL